MKITYRQRLVIITTCLSVFLVSVCVFIYYRYTYNIVMDGISKNLVNATNMMRFSLDDSDIERIKRLKSKISPLLSYSDSDIAILKKGGIVTGLAEDARQNIEKDADFLFLVDKIRKLALQTGDPLSIKDTEYDPQKLHDYIAKGVVVPYITYFDSKYSEYKLSQTIIAPVYQDTGDIKGNSPGTTWVSSISDEHIDDYKVYVNDKLFTDEFYTALFSGTPIFDKNGKFIAYLGCDYPAGGEIQKLENLKKTSYLLVFISVFVGLALSVAVSKRMSGSLKKLTDAADNIKNNNYDVIVNIPDKDEFGRLGDAFNNMAQSVKSTTTELKSSNERLMSLTADMHDGVGAVLTSIQIATRKENSLNIDNVHTLAKQGMSEIRFLMDAMEYETCTFELLFEGIGILAADILKPVGVSFEFIYEGDTGYVIPFQLYLDVQRIAREAFTNIIKHSDADRCLTELFLSDDSIRLSISDNGHPLRKPLTESGGKGLKNISYRAIRYNGTFSSERTGDGFSLRLHLPIPKNII